MSLPLATILTAIRARHPAFDGSRVPDTVLASCLSDYQQQLIGRAVARDKGFLATSVVITINDAAFTDGVALPTASQAITGGTVTFDDTSTDELGVTTFERRFDPPTFPAVYLLDNRVWLTGQNTDWVDVTSVDLKYAPLAAAFAALTDLFVVPDAARPCLVAYGAMEAAIRCAGLGEKVDVGTFASMFTAAEAAYLSTLRLSKRARHHTFSEGSY